MNQSPICLFAYNRPAEFEQTVEALKQNYLASESELFVFLDGPKDEFNVVNTRAVEEIANSICGFKSVVVYKSETNKGLANSIIEGITKIFELHETVIVLEDDLITSPNFLDFLNQGLVHFKDNEKIFSISGWSLDLPALKHSNHDYYCHYRLSSWGWGIWKDRWKKIQWEKSYFETFKKDSSLRRNFGKISADMPQMLLDYLNSTNNSWAIRACYRQFELGMYTIAPTRTKVNNIGFGSKATHTKNKNRFDQKLDSTLQRTFEFRPFLAASPKTIDQFRFKYSLAARLIAKIRDTFSIKS